MRYLIVAPQLGFNRAGTLTPGGLLQFGRCVARVLAGAPQISRLGIWAQVDAPATVPLVAAMLQTYAAPGLALDIRCFGGSRARLAAAVAGAGRTYDQVMYLLVNQAQLGLLPGHPPYVAWLIGDEVFRRLTPLKERTLRRASRLLSISEHTSRLAQLHNSSLPAATPVHLSTEPQPALGGPADEGQVGTYRAAERCPAVLIVGNLHRAFLYKGHQQLIDSWPAVLAMCPQAELWIAGEGDGRDLLEARIARLDPNVARQIALLGRLCADQLQERYRRCRILAMPSRGEGFGLVFVEAMRHGVPCIAGKYDAAREIVIHEQTGLLVEQHPHDLALACVRLLNDNHLAERLGAAGRRRYEEQFRFEHFRSRLLRALNLSLDT